MIRPSKSEEELLAEMDDYVEKMHTDNDLILDAYDYGITVARAQKEALEWLERNSLPTKVIPMAGANVANFDRLWLRSWMPALEDWFHYRNIDISTVRNLCKMLNPEIAQHIPEGKHEHRVHDCLDQTVDQYKFFVENFFFVTREA